MTIRFRACTPQGWNVDAGRLVIRIGADGVSGHTATIAFSVPPDFAPHPDLVAIALAPLAGSKFGDMHFDFPISDKAAAAIAASFKVEARSVGRVKPRVPGTRITLNFSGGFDSLAALGLLEDASAIDLVAVDYGSWLAKEAAYFRRFTAAHVVETDFRRKRWAINNWRFMGSASVLLADHFDTGTLAFGSIFEASPQSYAMALSPPRSDALFDGAGLHTTSWIRGLTEFATAMVVLRHYPSEIGDSLNSLGSPGGEKFFRKRALLTVAGENLGVDVPLPPAPPPDEKPVFGKYFATDFLAVYFAKRLGTRFIQTYMEGFPDDDPGMRALLRLDLDFYTKSHPAFLDRAPSHLVPQIAARLAQALVAPYSAGDFESYAAVARYLAKFHPVIALP